MVVVVVPLVEDGDGRLLQADLATGARAVDLLLVDGGVEARAVEQVESQGQGASPALPDERGGLLDAAGERRLLAGVGARGGVVVGLSRVQGAGAAEGLAPAEAAGIAMVMAASVGVLRRPGVAAPTDA